VLSVILLGMGIRLGKLDLLHYDWGWQRSVPTVSGAIVFLGAGICGFMWLAGLLSR